MCVCVCVCMYVLHLLCLFIYWWALGCFHILVIINSSAVNIEVHASFELCFISKFQEWSCWIHMVFLYCLFLVFRGTSIFFSTADEPIYVTTNSVREFLFLHILANIQSLSFWWEPFWQVWGDNLRFFICISLIINTFLIINYFFDN